ncbi:hypothetical protein [Rhizobium leguminosarum]|uniref:hypothetical protein n=1 Tax=Rhizobium leguminosarum TaxID=384 RepID=UPI0039658530
MGRRSVLANIALGGVATTPWCAMATEAALAGIPLTRDAALEADRLLSLRPGRAAITASRSN